MSFSRRKFVKAGIVAAACAGLPLKSALGAGGPEAGQFFSVHNPGIKSRELLGSIDQLGYYTKSTFASYVSSMFRVHLSRSDRRDLKLVEIVEYRTSLSDEADSFGTECFSLLFKTHRARPFGQDTYLIEHAALGLFYMFMARVTPDTKKNQDYYESVFYRRQQIFAGQDSTVVAETQMPAPAPAPWRVSEERVVEGPTGELSVVIERDVFSFGSLAAASSTVAGKKKKGPSALERAIKLNAVQAPAVGGLKLGMTAENVLALFPRSRNDKRVRSELSRPANRFGVSNFTIRPRKYSLNSDSDLPSEIVVTLLDGRVYTLYVGTDSPTWGHVDEFVTKFSVESGLPSVDYWEAHGGLDDQLKTLKCTDFEVSVFAGIENLELNYVQVIDMVAQRKLMARRKEAEATELNRPKP